MPIPFSDDIDYIIGELARRGIVIRGYYDRLRAEYACADAARRKSLRQRIRRLQKGQPSLERRVLQGVLDGISMFELALTCKVEVWELDRALAVMVYQQARFQEILGKFLPDGADKLDVRRLTAAERDEFRSLALKLGYPRLASRV